MVIFARDSTGKRFQFDPNDPNITKWPYCNPLDQTQFEDLYLVQGQWFHHSGNVLRLIASGPAPDYAMFFTPDQACDWFLAKGIELPEELSHLKPTASPTPEDKGLSNRQQDVLNLLYDLKAFTSDKRQTTEKIAGRLDGIPLLKDPVTALRKRRLIETRIGRGGGIWLSSSGKGLVEKQRKKK
jgi:hypothetical protein